MLNGWGQEKLAALGEQFQSLPDEQKQRIAKAICASVDDYHSNPPALVGDSIRYPKKEIGATKNLLKY